MQRESDPQGPVPSLLLCTFSLEFVVLKHVLLNYFLPTEYLEIWQDQNFPEADDHCCSLCVDVAVFLHYWPLLDVLVSRDCPLFVCTLIGLHYLVSGNCYPVVHTFVVH